MERSSGRFTRRIRLPRSVDAAHIDANFSQGVLRVIIPKLQNPEGESAR
jgi:HSP20 family molecular chaperone IbpA